MEISRSLHDKIVVYYTRYYRDVCGLQDWQVRAEKRVYEESDEISKMRELETLLRQKFAGQTHTIVGAGTGGLAISLSQKFGVAVYGVEPDTEALQIIHEKCAAAGIPLANFRAEYGEKMSFSDNMFDVVHCYTVLEHVADVKACLREMVRVTRPGGVVYIHTPNYAFPYEGHYKVFFPTFLPRFFGSLYLRLLRRPTSFLRTINFITARDIDRLLIRVPNIIWARVYRPAEPTGRGVVARCMDWLIFKRFVYPNQEIVIYKK